MFSRSFRFYWTCVSLHRTVSKTYSLFFSWLIPVFLDPVLYQKHADFLSIFDSWLVLSVSICKLLAVFLPLKSNPAPRIDVIGNEQPVSSNHGCIKTLHFIISFATFNLWNKSNTEYQGKPYHDIIIRSIIIQVCLCSFGIDEEELWELWKITPPSTFKVETTSAYCFKIVVSDLKRGHSYTVSLSHTPSSANIYLCCCW